MAWGGGGRGLVIDSVPVVFASLAFLEESPHEGVDDIRLVLLQPEARPRNNVESKVIFDVQTARLGHFLLQEGIPLSPQQQNWSLDIILAEWEGTVERAPLNGSNYTVQA